MKKTIIFLAAAAVALVACNKTEFTGPEAEGEQPVSFRIAVNNLTKTDVPFTGINPGASGANYIPIVSSSHYSDGTTIAAKTSFEYLKYLDSYWYLADANLNDGSAFPLGDTRMDVLAFLGHYDSSFNPDDLIGHPFHFETTDGGQLQGEYMTAYNEGWGSLDRAGWCPVLTDNTNYANKAYFINVATPQYNYDFMYGSANEIKKGEDRTLTLKHAMAALYFNIAFAGAIPEGVAMDPPLFIKPGNPGEDFYEALVDCDIYDISHPYNSVDQLYSYLSGSYYYNFLSLKTVGTFIVDNSKNNLEASWYLGNWNNLSNWNTYYDTQYWGEGYAYLQNYDDSNAINTVSDKSNLDFRTYLSNGYSSPFNVGTYYRVGAQLVPEQEIVNPWLRYRIGNQIYLTEVNLPRGTWKMGHAYIYNLKLNFNGTKFTVEVEPYEYLTGGHYLEY